MPKALPSEKSSFTVVNDGVAVSFKAQGSVIGGIAEAMSWLPAVRRQKLIDRLQKQHADMTAKEAERAVAAQAGA